MFESMDFNEYRIKLICKIINDFYEFGECDNSNTVLDIIYTIVEFEPNSKKCEGNQKDDQ